VVSHPFPPSHPTNEDLFAGAPLTHPTNEDLFVGAPVTRKGWGTATLWEILTSAAVGRARPVAAALPVAQASRAEREQPWLRAPPELRVELEQDLVACPRRDAV